MRRGDEQARDEILLAHLHAAAAFAAALLRAIGGERHALDVAEMGDGDDHVLALDQVLVLDLAFCSAITVRRGVANSSFSFASSSLMIAWMRARERRMSR